MLQDRTDHFILAYDAPSFSAAAAKVPMSPQGFTKVIHNLERDLGVPLFVLDEGGVRHPTPYADELYEYAKHMQVERNLLEGAFERIAMSGYVEIRLASALGVRGLLGLNVFDEFRASHPDVSIQLSELPDATCDSLTRDGLYDLALTTLPVPDDFATTELFRSPVLYWVRRDDPLSTRASLELDDLAGRRIAVPGSEFKCHRALVEGFERAGLEPPDLVECSEIFWIYEFVLHGEGVGFSLPHLAELEVFSRRDEVVALPLKGFSWGFGISHLKARSLSHREEEFVSYLAERMHPLSARFCRRSATGAGQR